jgi:hypothetical protein
LSLIDQFEVQFNELSSASLTGGKLDELQPVEIAGIVNQEVSRIQSSISPSDKVETIEISLSSHDYKRLAKFEDLLTEGLENLLKKTVELRNLNSFKDTTVAIFQDPNLARGIAKSSPIISLQPNSENFLVVKEIIATKQFVIVINGLKKELSQGVYTLGRGSDADIQVNDTGISRKHLSITVSESVIVKDLDSTNGTFIGVERITEIKFEDEIEFRVGVTEIKIVSEFK